MKSVYTDVCSTVAGMEDGANLLFCQSQLSMAVIHEIIRQKKNFASINIDSGHVIAGLLMAAGCIKPNTSIVRSNEVGSVDGCLAIAVLHIPMADIYGNIVLDSSYDINTICAINEICKAENIIITAEQIVSSETVRRNKARSICLSDKNIAVAQAPYGAYPFGLCGRYDKDKHIVEMLGECTNDDGFSHYIKTRIASSKDWMEYVSSVGIKRLMELTYNRRGI